MFTALVLICLNGDIDDKCFVSKHPVIFESRDSCIETIAIGVQGKVFHGKDPITNQKWSPTAWKCVDWIEGKKEV